MLDKTNSANLETVTFTSKVEVLAADLFAALNRCALSASNEETRYYLCGAYVHVLEGKLRIVSTDGHRLCAHAMEAEGASPNFLPIIWPLASMKETLATMRKAKLHKRSNWLVRLEVSMNAARVTFGGCDTIIDFKPIDGTFPDYLRVIPRGNFGSVSIDRETFIKAVSAVHAFGSANDESKMNGPATKLTFTEGRMVASYVCDAGSARFEVKTDDFKYESKHGPDFVIGFDGRYLLDFAKGMDSDRIEIHFADAGSPVILSAPYHSHETYVLMPMRVR